MSSNTLDDSDNVTCVQRLELVVDLLLLHEEQALSLDFNVVVLLLCGPLAKTATSTNTTLRAGFRLRGGIVDGNASAARVRVVLSLLLLFLFAFLAPYFVNIKKLDSDEISFEGSVPVFATTDEMSASKSVVVT